MTTVSNNMACPVCQTKIRLRDISPSSNPIYKYPAVRGCPSCGTALRFAQPWWVTPVMVVLALVGFVGLIFVLQSLGVIDGSAAAGRNGRQSKAPGIFMGLILAAVLLPIGVWLTRSKMQISIATHEDVRNYAGR